MKDGNLFSFKLLEKINDIFIHCCQKVQKIGKMCIDEKVFKFKIKLENLL